MAEERVVSLRNRGDILSALFTHPALQYETVIIAIKAPAIMELMALAGKQIEVREATKKIIAASAALFTYTAGEGGVRPTNFGTSLLPLFLRSSEDVQAVSEEIRKILPRTGEYRR